MFCQYEKKCQNLWVSEQTINRSWMVPKLVQHQREELSFTVLALTCQQSRLSYGRIWSAVSTRLLSLVRRCDDSIILSNLILYFGFCWLCCLGIVWEPIRKTNSHATRQRMLVYSRLSLLNYFVLIFGLKIWNWCPRKVEAGGGAGEKEGKKRKALAGNDFSKSLHVRKKNHHHHTTILIL